MLPIKQLLCSYLQSHLFLLHHLGPNFEAGEIPVHPLVDATLFFFKDFSFRLMEVAQRDFTPAVPEESLPSISFPWNKWAPFCKRSTVSLCPWSLSQSRNKTKPQPYMSLFLATLQSGPCQVFLSQRFFSQRKMLREKKKKNLSANVSKFEVRCQLLALVVKISSLCICKAACMALW